MSAGFVFGLTAFVALIAILAVRDHRRTIATRRQLLDACRGVIDDERWTSGDDGFPALEGRAYGRAVVAKLIPDTMVVRRLPQLWLSVTMKHRIPDAPSISILARFTGNEFYASTLDLPHRIDPPIGFPLDVLIRGDGARASRLCHDLAPMLAKVLADERVKEIILAPNGVRIVRQAAEGRRGEHLLLRQAVFDDCKIDRPDFVHALSELADLAAQRDARLESRAA
ncbi:MAG: hypothetical protein MUC37_05970 [Hyphomicrobium sp.]|jgi:hypothetical protein|nr:hypothetical protein [Hyphomicrobium sp.]